MGQELNPRKMKSLANVHSCVELNLTNPSFGKLVYVTAEDDDSSSDSEFEFDPNPEPKTSHLVVLPGIVENMPAAGLSKPRKNLAIFRELLREQGTLADENGYVIFPRIQYSNYREILREIEHLDFLIDIAEIGCIDRAIPIWTEEDLGYELEQLFGQIHPFELLIYVIEYKQLKQEILESWIKELYAEEFGVIYKRIYKKLKDLSKETKFVKGKRYPDAYEIWENISRPNKNEKENND